MEEVFSQRILNVDSFMSPPIPGLDLLFSKFKKSKIKRVPVIRVFGSTPSGQSVCSYIHGAFPYLLIPYSGPGGSPDCTEVRQYLYQAALSLDQALNGADASKGNQEHVFKITLICGRPYYGYHAKEEPFMKVYFYFPSDVKRSSELLQAGAILNTCFQPYEAHVPFILQFFLDYNLYGMNLLHSKCTWFRNPLDKPITQQDISRYATSSSEKSKPSSLEKNSSFQPDVASLSQIQHFNWNRLRRNCQDSEISRADSEQSPQHATQQEPCSQKCASLLHKSIANNSYLSHTTVGSGTCPFHTKWDRNTVPSDAIVRSSEAKRLSTCELEVDIMASDILNRVEIGDNAGKNPGIQSIWADERARRRTRGESSQIAPPTSQTDRSNVCINNLESHYLTELNNAVNRYYEEVHSASMNLEPSPKSENTATPPQDLMDSFLGLSAPKSRLKSQTPSEESGRKASSDLFSVKSSEKDTCSPIVNEDVISQVLSTSQVWASQKSSNTSILDLLQDMDTVQNYRVKESDDDDLETDWDELQHEDREKFDETLVMTQPWESGVEDLLRDDDYNDTTQLSDDENILIPQLDGAADEIKDKNVGLKKQAEGPQPPRDVVHDPSSNPAAVQTFHGGNVQGNSCMGFEGSMGEVRMQCSQGLSDQTRENIAKVICQKLKRQNSNPADNETTFVGGLDNDRNMFSTFQSLMAGVTVPVIAGVAVPLVTGVIVPLTMGVNLSNQSFTYPTTLAPNYTTNNQRTNSWKKAKEPVASVSNKSLNDQNNNISAVLPQNLGTNDKTAVRSMSGVGLNASKSGMDVTAWDGKPDKGESPQKETRTSKRTNLRPRRSRQISSYVSDPLFETEFENDWEDISAFSNKLNSDAAVHVNRRSTQSKRKTRKPKQEKVFIKWIITNRFKGIHNMKVQLWRIPQHNPVVLSDELLRLYEQYSPKRAASSSGPRFGERPVTYVPKPAKIPKPQTPQTKPKVPKGKRTKENVVTPFQTLAVEESKVAKQSTGAAQDQAPILNERNLFTDALFSTGGSSPIDSQKEAEKLEPPPTEAPLLGKETPANTCVRDDDDANIFTSIAKEIAGQEDITLGTESAPQCRNLGTPVKCKLINRNKVKAIRKRVKSASHKLSKPIFSGRSKAFFEPSKLSIKKAKRREARKRKYKELIKRSHVLPVINRTVTPINLSSTESKDAEADTSTDSARENIFIQITPFVASETVAMLHSAADLPFSAQNTDNSKVQPHPQPDSISDSGDTLRVSEPTPTVTPDTSISTVQVGASEAKSVEVPGLDQSAPPICNTRSVRSQYVPTRRVTRHSVTARMKSLKMPEWMCDVDDNFVDGDLENVLATLGRQSPIPDNTTPAIPPPRPWSPMLTPEPICPPDTNPDPSTELTNIDTELDLDAVSMLNDIEGMEEIIKEVKMNSSQESNEDDNLLSHLDALLQGEGFGAVTEDDSAILEASAASGQPNTDVEGLGQPSAAFMDVLLCESGDKPKPAVGEIPQSNEEKNTASTVASKGVSTETSKPVSKELSADASKAEATHVSKTLSGNTKALPNKQSLQEQLQKQMQAVFLQQQMLDNNNFRNADFMLQNAFWPKPKSGPAPATTKANSVNSDKPQKDLLGSVCQHVLSDAAIPVNTSTFDIVLDSATQYQDGKSQALNTFLYPVQPLDSIITDKKAADSSGSGTRQAPILTMPVALPVSNPVQVLHTHVHHHHHIHSIKDDFAASSAGIGAPYSRVSFQAPSRQGAPKSENPAKPSRWPGSQFAGSPHGKALWSNPVRKTGAKFSSILMKPTCQNGDERYWLQIQMQHGIPWDGGGGGKPIKQEKTDHGAFAKPAYLGRNPARTPYGLMKNNRKKQPVAASGGEKALFQANRMTNWRKKSPDNSPTICLTQTSNPADRDTGKNSGFELSQDMFDGSGIAQSSQTPPTSEGATTASSAPTSSTRKRPAARKSTKPSRPKQSRSSVTKTGSKMDGYCSRFSTVPFVMSQLCKPAKGESPSVPGHAQLGDQQELILNCETGKWDVVDLVGFDSTVPVALGAKRQLLNTAAEPAVHLAGNLQSFPNQNTPLTSPDAYFALGAPPSCDNPDADKEYVVSGPSDPSASLKLKLTLKKSGSLLSSHDEAEKAHDSADSLTLKRRGKPSCFKEIVKRSKLEVKRSNSKKAPKKKLSGFYLLDTSVSSEFVSVKERYNFLPHPHLDPVNPKPQGQPFDPKQHMTSVVHFCLVRSRHVDVKVEMPLRELGSDDVLTALAALKFEGQSEVQGQPGVAAPASVAKHPFSNYSMPLQGQDVQQSVPSTSRLPPNAKSVHQERVGTGGSASSSDLAVSRSHTDDPFERNTGSCAVYTAFPAPPTRRSVEKYLEDNTQAEDLSQEPFYSDRSDVQSCSSRVLSTLPSYVKIPKAKSGGARLLPEFRTSVSPGIKHWRVVLVANLMASSAFKPERSVNRAREIVAAESIPDVDPYDLLDVASKVEAYPALLKTFFKPGQQTVVTPLSTPPTYGQVENWLKAKIKPKEAEKLREKPEAEAPCSQPANPPTPKPNRVFKPRKVSFELFNASDQSEYNEDGSEYFSSEVISPNKFMDSAQLAEDSDDSFCLQLSNHSEPMLSLDASPESPSNGKGSSSAIATLVGSSERVEDDVSLTPLLSGKFVTSQLPGAEPERFQSTPVAGRSARKSARNLVYTPIARAQTPIAGLKPSQTGSNKFSQRMESLHTPAGKDSSEYDSEIVGPSLGDTFGFRAPQLDLGEAKTLHERQFLKVLSMELHVKTRLELKPDPELDPIQCLYFALQTDSGGDIEIGALVLADGQRQGAKLLSRSGVTNLNTTYVKSEDAMFDAFASYVVQRDVDVLLGYEVQMLSWGYLLDRAAHLGYDLCRAISRVPSDETHNRHSSERDVFGADNASEIHVVGRLVLNLWRLMRTEVALCDYSFQSVAFHLLHERYPNYTHRTLTGWWSGGTAMRKTSCSRHRVVDFYMCKVLGNLKLITQQDLIGRTSELARVFGIQFYDVLTRGSQFRVESMMLRLAHSLNYVAVSPTPRQRAAMKAPECIPLVMEPESRFYSEPVIVVDFQSLYPSVVIAHNYCFSTCLGRVQNLGKTGKFTFGCCTLSVPPPLLKKLLENDDVTVAPNGAAYVKANVRKGVLPLMLEEILNTRIMVKESMKKCGDGATKRMLDHRQLGLKLIANVTYGYTSASYSGRMPCVEIADSIVHKARETLERAIALVHRNHDRWRARVVYGDTDSMFVALPSGTSKERAFQVGREIVHDVTKDNPRPMKLKLEKIYQPCILQTKKRYVGYAYESEDQKEPIFDAKGIETVRRDGCPAVAKILEKSIRVLFDSKDVSKVKKYVEKQFGKILDGRSTTQDCTIAKEYRGAKYYRPGAIVPALVIARKKLAEDKRSEPRSGERVPYVIVHGLPGTPLFRLLRQPLDLLNDPRLRLHGTYYVTKMVLPALDRMMSLAGVDVFQWYRDLPRTLRFALPQDVAVGRPEGESRVQSKKVTISQYFESHHCASCHKLSTNTICDQCMSPNRRHVTAVKLMTRSRNLERKYQQLSLICSNCSGSPQASDVKCTSLSCPILYKRARAGQDTSTANFLRNSLRNNDLF